MLILFEDCSKDVTRAATLLAPNHVSTPKKIWSKVNVQPL